MASPPADLRLYALLRSDIRMSPGKAIAQAGHAFLQAYLDAQTCAPQAARLYASETPNTKIALDGGDLTQIELVLEKARMAGIPASLVVDHGHVELPDFDGSDTPTALGIGPLSRDQARRLLGRLKLWTGGGAS